jgi:hypothetical protein
MRFIRCVLLSGLAVAFLLGLRAGAVPATEPDRYQMRFEIFGFGGLHLLTTRTAVQTSGGQYAITMDLTTRGLASVFVNLESHSEVRGGLIGDAVHPEQYSGEIHRNGTDQQTRIDYGADGAVLNTWSSPAVEPAAFVSAGQTSGTVDQLTAYFTVQRELAHRNTCASVIRVFDGVHRYNLHFSDAPPEALSGDITHQFPGPLRVCQVRRKDIGGFTNDSEGAYRGTIWYGRLPRRDRMVPVQMEFDTELGAVKGYLAELHGPNIDLRLLQ